MGGEKIKEIVNIRGEPYCFRVRKKSVYHIRQALLFRARCISGDKILSIGKLIGKFTHTGKFRLSIGALDIIDNYAKFKAWIKPSTESFFLHGNHINKSDLIRSTENIPIFAGVVIYNISNIPLGF